MTANNIENLKEALISFGASDLNENILNDISLTELMELSVDESKPRLCFRSAWALEHILLKNTNLFSSSYKILISNYVKLNNWSSLRSYTKLVMWLVSNKNLDIQLTEEERENILEKTFQIIENSGCPVAVKVNGFDILYDLCPYFEGLSQELKVLIELNLEKENTPALKSRGTYILKRLRN